MKRIIILLLIMIIGFNNINAEEIQNNTIKYKARVTKDIITYTEAASNVKYQKVMIKIISNSEYKDNEYEAKYVMQILDTAQSKKLKEGDTVYVSLESQDENKITFNIEDVYRIPYVTFVIILFLLLLLIIGKIQGLKTIISLLVTFAAIFYILIPLIIKGYSAILVSLLVCSIIAIISFVLIAGFTKKGIVATIGTICGVAIAATLALGVSYFGRITGLSDEHSQMLIYVTRDMNIDLNGIFFAGIIIGTIGATMDIAMSISSSMSEISNKVKNISSIELIKSGMNVGKDAMGTMSNTLILAYVGESITVLILFILNNPNWVSIINSDYIATEILRGFCSTIGMILTIPITASIYGLLHNINKK